MGDFYASEIFNHLLRQKVIPNVNQSLRKMQDCDIPTKFALSPHTTKHITLKTVGASVFTVHFEVFSLLTLENSEK